MLVPRNFAASVRLVIETCYYLQVIRRRCKLVLQGRLIISFCQGIFKLTSRLIMLILWTAPVGLTFLIAPNILKVKNFEDLVGGVSKLGLRERA